MSRDLTPRELYEFDKKCREDGRGSFLDQNIFYVTPNGEETPLMSEEEVKFRKTYPILGLCFGPLWTWYNKKPDEIRRSILNNNEIALKTYVASSAIGDSFKTLKKWFEGELDTGFYYCERNNELFEEFLDECYRKRERLAGVVHDIQADLYASEIRYPYVLSSGSTSVFPISVWQRTINIKLCSEFNKKKTVNWINSFVNEHKDILADGRICANDESCSPEIEFVLVDEYVDR